ncbi:nuclear inhibitor of protein phosphatase 1-like isoform X2 [Rhopilema esculentum]|uniref:nuclear inhibitor of protein phosphatase 1-like isoform X2 n=1 Tax=Rhopilema esculentum TaxID=499914 RepID=UPI0031D9EE06
MLHCRVGKPPAGMHLDVSKNDKLVEKLIIDGKDYFLFGRLRDHVDFPLDHASCSRVHAALVFHRHLKRMFIIDLGSTHGTFVGSIRVDPHKPVQVLVDSTLAFGASTRRFTLRERPNAQVAGLDSLKDKDDKDKTVHSLLGLPEEDTALDDLTEYNTAQNRRHAVVNDDVSNIVTPKKRRRSSTIHVIFKDGEEIINPEDIDPTVGRFRNLVQTEMVVPTKKIKFSPAQSMTESITKRMQSFSYAPDLYADIPSSHEENHAAGAMAGKISITSAPDVVSPKEKVNPIGPVVVDTTIVPQAPEDTRQDISEPRKKKYAKEAWPGKRPGPNLLSV